MTDLAPLNLREFEWLARERLPQAVYDYFAGGAGDERSLQESPADWARWRIRPRVLVDVSACDAATTILGQPVATPVMTAPCAFNTLAHPDGELGVARAAVAEGMVQVLSTMATTTLEAVAATAPGPRWFQLYCHRDRGLTRELVQRAEAAGYTALCLTVDVPAHGERERDRRNRFHLPDDIRPVNVAAHLPELPGGSALAAYIQAQFDPSLDWSVIAWLRGLTRLPLVLKGILTAEDARLGVEHGVEGIGVSNHGGRQLDGTVTPAEALPEVVEAVAGRAEVFVDGGIRRGTDVFTALALGARGVMVGRPYLWGLAVAGEAGARQVLRFLNEGLRNAMALAGCQRIAGITRDHVRRSGAT